MLAIKYRYSAKPVINLTFLVKKSRFFSTYNWTAEEVRIPVPWGHIAGKWWGPQNKRPILGLHGWQDNCGSFDTLIPYLDPHVGILTVDFPGHGLSSYLPEGSFYHWPDYVIFIKRIVDYFKWPKVSLMGHSMGGITSFMYSIYYPESVDFLICLDALKPLTFNKKSIPAMGKDIDNFIKYDQVNSSTDEPPSYPLQELELKLHEGSYKSISLEKCKHILQRGITPSAKEPNRYYYKRDARLKILPILNYSQNDLVKYIERLICPTILCQASDKLGRYKVLKKGEEFYDILRKSNKNFETHKVEGSHHVHLNNPERIQNFVNLFINKYNIEDRSMAGFNPEIFK